MNALNALRPAVRGRVLLPGDAGFDAARRPWNLAVEQPVAAVVEAAAAVALGGGLSWFGRAHGWVADAVTALDVVDADGRARHVTADGDPDLFWALRGAGGDFAIVTGLELALHPAPRLFGGRMVWAAE